MVDVTKYEQAEEKEVEHNVHYKNKAKGVLVESPSSTKEEITVCDVLDQI